MKPSARRLPVGAVGELVLVEVLIGQLACVDGVDVALALDDGRGACGHQTRPFRLWPCSMRGRSRLTAPARMACENGLRPPAPAPNTPAVLLEPTDGKHAAAGGPKSAPVLFAGLEVLVVGQVGVEVIGVGQVGVEVIGVRIPALVGVAGGRIAGGFAVVGFGGALGGVLVVAVGALDGLLARS